MTVAVGATRTSVLVLRSTARLLLPALGAFAVICGAIAALDANPFSVLDSLITGALGTQFALSETLMITVPLTLTGLAAAIPFSARIWNVGGDGQLYVGATAAVLVALTIGPHIPGELISAASVLAGILAGAVWALVAGVIKVTRNGNEIIVTLMLNLLAGLVADYVVTGPWAQGIEPQTRIITSSARFPSFWQPGFNVALFIAIGVSVVLGVLMSRTRTGFGIRAAGRNVDASRLAGFSVRRLWLGSFAIGGACAGLAGALLIVAFFGAVIPGMGEQYGYTGIAVALVAGLRPFLIVPAAFFFAIIEVGGASLSATGLSTAIGYVIEAVIVIVLLAFRVIRVRT
jgi:simple sugar transport system permease protein